MPFLKLLPRRLLGLPLLALALALALALTSGCRVDCTTASDCDRNQFCGGAGVCQPLTDGGNGIAATMAVLAVQPQPNSSGAPAHGPVVVLTTRAVDASTLNATSFALTDSHGQPLKGSFDVTSNPDGFLFAPASPLAASATFNARVTTAVRGLDGTPLSAPVSWTFTVAP